MRWLVGICLVAGSSPWVFGDTPKEWPAFCVKPTPGVTAVVDPPYEARGSGTGLRCEGMLPHNISIEAAMVISIKAGPFPADTSLQHDALWQLAWCSPTAGSFHLSMRGLNDYALDALTTSPYRWATDIAVASHETDWKDIRTIATTTEKINTVERVVYLPVAVGKDRGFYLFLVANPGHAIFDRLLAKPLDKTKQQKLLSVKTGRVGDFTEITADFTHIPDGLYAITISGDPAKAGISTDVIYIEHMLTCSNAAK
jgi:hypothetical protein